VRLRREGALVIAAVAFFVVGGIGVVATISFVIGDESNHIAPVATLVVGLLALWAGWRTLTSAVLVYPDRVVIRKVLRSTSLPLDVVGRVDIQMRGIYLVTRDGRKVLASPITPSELSKGPRIEYWREQLDSALRSVGWQPAED
jgi:hypothetical protein